MESSKILRIMIVEDDDSMRAAFERMVELNPTLSLMGSAASLRSARSVLACAAPAVADVAIIDLGLPDGDGAELIDMLHRDSPRTAVMVSTVFGDEAHVVRAIEAGARGYLLKDTTTEELARSIRTVYDGGAPLSPQVARHLLKRFSPAIQPASRRKGLDELTPREVEVLTRMSQGFSNVETAAMMHLSPHTVTTHIKNIYSKLAVHNRIAAVNEGREKGLIR